MSKFRCVYRGGNIDFATWLFPNQKLNHKLSYGNVVAMPDMFANPNKVISEGVTSENQKMRFMSSFNVFHDETSKHIAILDKILSIIDEEIALVKKAIADGKQPSVEYAKKSMYFNIKYLEANPSMLNMLLHMNDHFSGNINHDSSWLAYQAGHEIAIDTAIDAFQAKDVNQKNNLLMLAYAMNGYACHFLSDRFASGHLRVPLVKLKDLMTGDDYQKYGSVVGGLLIKHYAQRR